MASGVCETCQVHRSKYCCPGCLRKTCSLECCKKHKSLYSCNGKRQKIAYVGLNDFTDKQLAGDVEFLESVAQKIVVSSDENRGLRHVKQESLRCSHAILTKLTKAARIRNISLRLSPFMTTRRKRNSTYCNAKSAYQVNDKCKMRWHIRWIFSNTVYEAKSVPEDMFIKDLLHDIVTPGNCQMKNNADLLKMRNKISEEIQSNCTPDQLKVAMLAEHINTSRSIYMMDLSKSLLDNLRGKTVVEHPIFLIMTDGQLIEYNVINSDKI